MADSPLAKAVQAYKDTITTYRAAEAESLKQVQTLYAEVKADVAAAEAVLNGGFVAKVESDMKAAVAGAQKGVSLFMAGTKKEWAILVPVLGAAGAAVAHFAPMVLAAL